jgi:hypothetical protein
VRSVMAKARKKITPKPAPHHPIEEQASPELRSLIKTHDVLPRGNWDEARAIKDAHGHESAIAKHVDKVWTQHADVKEKAFRAALAFPARGYADIAVKLAFASQQWPVSAVPPVSLAFSAALADAKRLAQATPPKTADKALLDLVSAAEAAMAVHQALPRGIMR